MNRIKTLVICAVALSLGACSNFIKRDEFDSTVADLRAADTAQAGVNEDLRGQLEEMQFRFGELTNNLQSRFSSYDAQIAQLQGRIHVDMTANFAYDDSTLREEDKAPLGEFADVLTSYHDNVIVTVEGFTDPAGNAEYNKWLGMERAKAVREYLIQNGLPADKVRAVSYGEDDNRQITPGAWGDAGSANRRVALVIDYVAG
ncbi:MAG: OmpA family protein [Gammaproteobacteria bacterium]